MNLTTQQKLEALRAHFRELGSVLVCYSGGIDSALLLAVATEQLRDRAVGLTAVSPSLPNSEREGALAFARQIGARHELVDSHEILREGYVQNGPDRCFHCKTELYQIAEQKRVEWGLSWVVNGTNRDDLGDYRPGLEAARNASIRSPFLDLGLSKADVRSVAVALDLALWDKPASACLSSRIPYGTSVTRSRLAQVGGLEAALRSLGLVQVRTRYHALGQGDLAAALARVEVSRAELPRAFELRDEIVRAGKDNGFQYVTLDLEGYRSGSHNEVLVGRSLRVVDDTGNVQ